MCRIILMLLGCLALSGCVVAIPVAVKPKPPKPPCECTVERVEIQLPVKPARASPGVHADEYPARWEK